MMFSKILMMPVGLVAAEWPWVTYNFINNDPHLPGGLTTGELEKRECGEGFVTIDQEHPGCCGKWPISDTGGYNVRVCWKVEKGTAHGDPGHPEGYPEGPDTVNTGLYVGDSCITNEQCQSKQCNMGAMCNACQSKFGPPRVGMCSMA